MGCISSKVIARSISLHEERKQGSRRSANGIPLLEDLIISANGSDQYLALIRAANTVSNKLHSRSLSSNTSPKLAIEPVSSEINDEPEISAKLGQEGGKQAESDKNIRSKSWHWFPDHIAQENSSGFEDKNNLSSKGGIGSRSFHTVEEYDDMVNKLWLSKSPGIQQNMCNDEEDGVSATIKDFHYPCSDNQCSLEESKTVKEISIQSMAPESSIVAPSPSSQISSSGTKNEEVGPSQKTSMHEIGVQGVSTIEKGNKRKAIAKRIGSLGIPSNIQCASLREWLPARGIYSPGSYVTPKFGSYSMKDIRNENESGEDSIFSPELVSAFEECMQELEAEEESILKQIIEDVEEEKGGEMHPQERTPPSIQG